MLCPNCKTENLVTSERQNIQIDHCPRCRGVWLDRGELEKLLQLGSPDDERPSDRYNGRELGQDEETPRKRSSGETDQDDDDDDRGSERGGSYQSRDRDSDDDRGTERGETYRNREREDDQRTGRDQPEGKSIWREIFENLGDKLPRP
jgi:Zn-finger nucleic acid-binding protein